MAEIDDLRALLADAEKALKPFAEKFIVPDDWGEESAADYRADEDWNEAENNATLDDVWVQRGWIRAAREVIARIAASRK